MICVSFQFADAYFFLSEFLSFGLISSQLIFIQEKRLHYETNYRFVPCCFKGQTLVTELGSDRTVIFGPTVKFWSNGSFMCGIQYDYSIVSMNS